MKRFISAMVCLVMMLIGQTSLAFTPTDIVALTRGKTTLAQAKTIVAAVYAHSYLNEIDPNVVFKIIKIESSFNRFAKSKHNAMGLMQVMPKWHKNKIKGRDIYETNVNIEVGCIILKEYLDLERGNLKGALSRYSGDRKGGYYVRVMAVKLPAAKLLAEQERVPDEENRSGNDGGYVHDVGTSGGKTENP